MTGNFKCPVYLSTFFTTTGVNEYAFIRSMCSATPLTLSSSLSYNASMHHTSAPAKHSEIIMQLQFLTHYVSADSYSYNVAS